MKQASIQSELTKYHYDNKTWLYNFMNAFFFGFVQNNDYTYDLKPTKKVNVFPITSYSYDTFSILNTDYDYFCGNMNKLSLQNDYFSVSAASSGVFWKHTATELETGFDYFGARYYSSDLSIWLSVDPLSDKYPSTSPFMYVLGNPINMIDPDGRSSDWVENDGKVFWDDNVNSQKEANAKYGNDAVHHEEYIAQENGNFYNLNKDGSVDASNGITPTDRIFSSTNGIVTQGDLSGVSITSSKENNKNTQNNSDYSQMFDMAIPVAVSVEGSFSGECGWASSGNPYGGIFIFRGQDAWTYTGFSAVNLGAGWFGASATASQTTYYYFGDLDNFGAKSFSGTSYQGQISFGELLIGGGHFNVVKDGFGGFLFGVGPDIGFGVGSPISGQLTWQTTKLHKK